MKARPIGYRSSERSHFCLRQRICLHWFFLTKQIQRAGHQSPFLTLGFYTPGTCILIPGVLGNHRVKPYPPGMTNVLENVGEIFYTIINVHLLWSRVQNGPKSVDETQDLKRHISPEAGNWGPQSSRFLYRKGYLSGKVWWAWTELVMAALNKRGKQALSCRPKQEKEGTQIPKNQLKICFQCFLL